MTIDIAITTWPNHPARLGYFADCVMGLKERLSASRHTLRWICSSESEHAPDAEWRGASLETLCKRYDIALHWRGGKPGLAENMNAALRLCTSNYILLVQDDQHLVAPLDLSPGAEFLAVTPSVDLLRYEWPPDDRVVLLAHPDGWRRFDVHHGWPYGDRPHLRRRSFMEKWGWYAEGRDWQGASEGEMICRLRGGNAEIAAADQRYFENVGKVSCDVNNKRWPSNR